jgi:hypothetical protein
MGELIQSVMNLVNKVRFAKFKYETRRISFILFLWFLGLITGLAYYYAVQTYNKLLEPRVIIINNAQASTETQEIEPQEVIKEKDLSDYIWFKESTRGQHNYSKCEAQGKFNSVGYGIPGDGTYMCFNSHAEEMDAVKKWIAQHKEEGLNSRQLLCHYNQGTVSDNCAYVSQFYPLDK